MSKNMIGKILVPLAGILAIAVVYLFFVFCFQQINPVEWGAGGRVAFAMFAMFANIAAMFGVAFAMFAKEAT